jgi:hypothetical protein
VVEASPMLIATSEEGLLNLALFSGGVLDLDSVVLYRIR